MAMITMLATVMDNEAVGRTGKHQTNRTARWVDAM